MPRLTTRPVPRLRIRRAFPLELVALAIGASLPFVFGLLVGLIGGE